MTTVSFLDQITIDHGPASLFGRYFLLADQVARDVGIRLQLRTDMEELLAVNQQNLEHWYPMLSVFDVRFNKLGPDNAFWIQGINAKGETVLTQAGRCYDWRGTNAAEEIGSMRFLYEDPARDALPGEHWGTTAPTASLVSGLVGFSGSFWIRPDHRGHELSRFLPRLTRTCLYVHFGTDYTFGFLKHHLYNKGYVQRYGYTDALAEPAVVSSNTRSGDWDAMFCWMPQAELIEETRAFCSNYEEAAVNGGRQDKSIAIG